MNVFVLGYVCILLAFCNIYISRFKRFSIAICNKYNGMLTPHSLKKIGPMSPPGRLKELIKMSWIIDECHKADWAVTLKMVPYVKN